jgi:Spy/CpxP family protein refolding chaperone
MVIKTAADGTASHAAAANDTTEGPHEPPTQGVPESKGDWQGGWGKMGLHRARGGQRIRVFFVLLLGF